jgi:hypothetical protein
MSISSSFVDRYVVVNLNSFSLFYFFWFDLETIGGKSSSDSQYSRKRHFDFDGYLNSDLSYLITTVIITFSLLTFTFLQRE